MVAAACDIGHLSPGAFPHAVECMRVIETHTASRARSASADTAADLETRRSRRIRTACRLVDARRPALLITHGVTGCGKSWLSERLIPALQAVLIDRHTGLRRTKSQSTAPAIANADPLARVAIQPSCSTMSPIAGASNPGRLPPVFSTPVAVEV